ncbi:MAG: hypothetical protein ABIR79_14635 [Candidatus Binatia bacterium]
MAPGSFAPPGWATSATGVWLGVAAAHPSVNHDLLAPPMLVDVPSGKAVRNGIPVTIAPA